ncbi:MAG: hypothetical protein ACRDKY_01840 [Solirubrobacteraceae bacterium]
MPFWHSMIEVRRDWLRRNRRRVVDGGLLVAVVVVAVALATGSIGGRTPSSSADECGAFELCVDGEVLDGSSIFLARADFPALARTWCALRPGAARQAVREVIRRTKGTIVEFEARPRLRDDWNVAVSPAGGMPAGAHVDLRLAATYAGDRVVSLTYERRADGLALPCAARRS